MNTKTCIAIIIIIIIICIIAYAVASAVLMLASSRDVTHEAPQSEKF